MAVLQGLLLLSSVILLVTVVVGGIVLLAMNTWGLVTGRGAVGLPHGSLGLVSVCVVLCVAAYLVTVRPALLRGQQVRTCIELGILVAELHRYESEQDRLPEDLAEIAENYSSLPRDGWGEPFIYVPNGDQFILVSAGKGGKPDWDYFSNGLRKHLVEGDSPRDVRGEWSADQIVTESGWFQHACK